MRITNAGFAVVNNDTHFSKWIEQTGKIDHNQEIATKFRQYFGPGDTAIDVGACLGDHTVPYAQIVGESGKVFAFEPNPEAFECLIYNTKNYPQITCFNFGISDIEESIGFVREENLGASFLKKDDSKQQVKLKSLDSLIGEFDFTKTKFMKIDVEGWETSVLSGSEKIITQYKPIMMIEIVANHQARYGKTPADIYNWLNDRGYNAGQPLNQPQYDMVAYPK